MDTVYIILGLMMLVFFIVSSAVAAIIVYRIRWPMFWEKWEELTPGRSTRTRKGRCRLIGFGDGGEEIFYLRGLKKYRAAYGKRLDKKTVVWEEGSDGYWYNVVPTGLDKRLLEVGIMPVDRDMRLTNATIRKGIENRYNEKSFMDKYGVLISFGLLFVCILALGGFLWMAMDKQRDISAANLEATKASKETMEVANRILSHIDNINIGGSGYVGT
jgi:hypothetical protein